MRKILGFGVVLAAAYLTSTWEVAYAQGAGQAGGGGAARSALGGAVNNVEQQAAQDAGLTNPAPNNAAVPGATTPAVPGATTPAVPGTTTPAVPGTTIPAVPGQTTGTVPGQNIVGAPAPGTVTTAPANMYQTSGTTGNVANPAGTTAPYAGTTTGYTSNYYPAGTYPGTYTGATPGYTNRIMPGMRGYNSVNPMATTMAPGYYYAGTAGTPYATTGYAPMSTTPGYYTTQPYGYTVPQRRGLFGGLFRRNRVTYPVTNYGNPYGTTPYGYTTYTNTTYYAAPGTYVYSGSPY
jgi:hypothetical protein